MYTPEYTITNKMLESLTKIEYLRAIAETKSIFLSWQKNLQKETRVNFIKANLNLLGIQTDIEEIKRFVDGLSKNPADLVKNIEKSMNYSQLLAQSFETKEKGIQNMYRIITDGKRSDSPAPYRQEKIKGKTEPEEILAEMTGLIDWLNSLDGAETHPLIKAAIIKANIMKIAPFKNYHELLGNLISYQILKVSKYDIKGLCHLEMAYCKDLAGYRKARKDLEQKEADKEEGEDLTEWIDFYLRTMASEATTKKEEFLLLSKDTKIAAATGKAKLSRRQEKIVAYLQDYGTLQNKDFERLFPKISEDTVLRELKKLVNWEIIVKKGKTKSSQYELK